MLDPNLGAVLVSSLASVIIDRETMKKAIDLLLYNASTFLQMRRKKLLKDEQTAEPSPATEQDQVPSQPEAGEPQSLPLRTGLRWDDARLDWAERELKALFAQIENHHKLLLIEQEQISQFGDAHVPPYKKLSVMREQRTIAEKLERMRVTLEDILDAEFPEIQTLSRIITETEGNV